MTDKYHLLRFGYAPGNYWFVCSDCGDKQAVGDKRATRCEACAESLHAEITSVEDVADKHRDMTILPEEAVKAADIIQVITDLRSAILQDDDEGLAEHAEPMIKAKELIAKLSASSFLPVQVAVKKLDLTVLERLAEYAEQYDHPDDNGPFPDIQDAMVTVGDLRQARKLLSILSALEPSAARELALEEAARLCETHIETIGRTRALEYHNPLNGEKHSGMTYAAAIRALSSPDHADAPHERAWYFNAGDNVPAWLEKIEKGNCTLTFGVNVVVTSKDGGYEVRPQGIADNAGPILHVVSHGNVTPEIKGGGNGVAVIGYNRPYDETAGWRIARLKWLLEMVRPYVECYDTREHNHEQDAVLTEIDKALSVLTEGDHNANAGKVEGDGWMPGCDRLPTLQEAAFAAKVLNACNGYDLSVWTDDLWPCDDASEGLRAIIAHSVLPSAPASEGAE